MPSRADPQRPRRGGRARRSPGGCRNPSEAKPASIVQQSGNAPQRQLNRNPGLVTIPLSCVVGMVASLLAPEREAAERYSELQHRLHLGPEADEA